MVRGQKVPDGRYHLVIHVCLFNKEGKMLIQQRQSFKPTWANMWDVSVGGAIAAGEDSAAGARREVAEELGLALDLNGKPASLSVSFPDGFDDYYIVEQDVDISTLQLQYEEVQAAKWASQEEILAMIDDGSFIPYRKSLIDFLFFRYQSDGSGVFSNNKA